MNFFKKLIVILLTLYFFIGCGEENSITGSTNVSLIVETQSSKLNELKNTMEIEFLVKSNYNSSVDIKLDDLSMSLSPCVIKKVTFIPNNISLNNKKREKSIHARMELNKECLPTNYSIKAKALLSLDGESNNVTFNSEVMEINPTIDTSTVVSTEDTNGSEIEVNDVTLPIVVIPNSLKSIELTNNSKNMEITIKVFKDIVPYIKGSVRVELPKKVLAGVDVGLFDAYEVPVNEQGVAIFNYTGPSNLQALMDSGDLSSSFKFYHIENSANKQELEVKYNIADEVYTPVNYSLTVSTKENDFSMGIPNLEKTFTILIKNSKEDIVTDINITKIEVESQNSFVAKLLNRETKMLENKIKILKENNSNFILVSNKFSGLVPVRVKVDFIDINNQIKHLSTVVNIRVMSGPPSAISISYLSSGQDGERAKYEDKFAVSVTDEYGNRVNTRPYISLGAIIGYAVDGREISSKETNKTKRLYYGKNDIDNSMANGLIDALDDNNINTTQFEDTLRSDVFKWINTDGERSDKLVVFGEAKNYEAMGKWDFNKINNSTLSLDDDYFGMNRDELFYAVGHNYYQDPCRDDGREWIGNTDSEKYQLDEEGTVIISYKYDYQLMGKDAMIWVNLSGFQSDTAKYTRIGEVVKHTLRGQGLRKEPENGYHLDKDAQGWVTFEIWHDSTNLHYSNAHFSWREKTESDCIIKAIKSSNLYDARTCNNGYSNRGDSYISFFLGTPEGKECNFDIERVLLSKEF
jgi:hypothetical protein